MQIYQRGGELGEIGVLVGGGCNINVVGVRCGCLEK